MNKNESILKEEIVKRIAALEKELNGFMQHANEQIAAYHGAIGELRRLIEPPKEKKESPSEEKQPL